MLQNISFTDADVVHKNQSFKSHKDGPSLRKSKPRPKTITGRKDNGPENTETSEVSHFGTHDLHNFLNSHLPVISMQLPSTRTYKEQLRQTDVFFNIIFPSDAGSAYKRSNGFLKLKKAVHKNRF